MSQHSFSATLADGGRVMVVMGFDRPLQGFFAMVEKLGRVEPDGEVAAVSEGQEAEPDRDEEEYLYCNLDDPALKSSYGISSDLGYFRSVLEGLGVTVPDRLMQEVQQDAVQNVGNRTVRYDSIGNVVEEWRERKFS